MLLSRGWGKYANDKNKLLGLLLLFNHLWKSVVVVAITYSNVTPQSLPALSVLAVHCRCNNRGQTSKNHRLVFPQCPSIYHQS